MVNGSRSLLTAVMADGCHWRVFFRPVPPLFFYFLLFVTAMGELGVTSMVSSELGVELQSLEVRVTLLSLVVGVGLPSSLLSLFELLFPWRWRPDKASPILVSIRSRRGIYLLWLQQRWTRLKIRKIISWCTCRVHRLSEGTIGSKGFEFYLSNLNYSVKFSN